MLFRSDFNAKTISRYKDTWWFVNHGRVKSGAYGLCKYNGDWWYIENSKVNFNVRKLYKYNGTWWFVEHGKINFKAKTLVKYNGIWWFVEHGKVNWNDEAVVGYSTILYTGDGWTGGSIQRWYYARNGRVDWNYSGNCVYNGVTYIIKNGFVVGATENATWKYDTRYAYKFNNIPMTWADGTSMTHYEVFEAETGKNKYACMYFAAGGDEIAERVCDEKGWSY